MKPLFPDGDELSEQENEKQEPGFIRQDEQREEAAQDETGRLRRWLQLGTEMLAPDDDEPNPSAA